MEKVPPAPAPHPRPWNRDGVLFYAGLLMMVGFWALAGFGVMFYATLSSAYNIECLSAPPPLSVPSSCATLAAQIARAALYTFAGTVLGLVGLVAALIAVRRPPPEGRAW